MNARERLLRAVDAMTEEEAGAALRTLAEASGDPVGWMLDHMPFPDISTRTISGSPSATALDRAISETSQAAPRDTPSASLSSTPTSRKPAARSCSRSTTATASPSSLSTAANTSSPAQDSTQFQQRTTSARHATDPPRRWSVPPRITHVTAIDARWLLDRDGELVATLRDGRRLRLGRDHLAEILV